MEKDITASSPFDLYDSGSNVSITFESESDALFAAFCLGDQLGYNLLFPSHIINAFIAFLKHPRFHGDQLTFKSTDDMTNSITQYRKDAIIKQSRHTSEAALQRRETALKRPAPYYGDTLAGNIPRIVLELVSEELVVEPFRHVPEQKALLNACLVHRSWKATVQHLLGRYITARNYVCILASPLIGPSTRRLYYHFDSFKKVYRMRIYQASLDARQEGPILIPEQAHNLSNMLSVCTSIRVLHIHGILNMSTTGSDPFHRIAQLQNLEVLSLGHSDSCRTSNTLLDVCTSLPNMRRLKSLELFRFECPQEQVIPPSLDELLPPPSLKVVEVHGCSNNERTEVLLSWLFRPRKTYSVMSTKLVENDLFYSNSVSKMMRRTLGLALRDLESITIDLYHERLIDILSICPRLRAVRLLHLYWERGLEWNLPGIEKLQVEHDGWHRDHYDRIKAIARMLPNLRSLIIVDPNYLWMDDECTDELPAFEIYCAQKGIEITRIHTIETIWW